MLRLVWRTDVHLSDRAPSSRRDDWAETVFVKLTQIGQLCQAIRAVGVLDGGDFFHVKSPSRNSHELVRRAAELQAAYPCPTFATVGNHDCVYGDITYLHQQPLGVLFESEVFGRLYNEHEVYFTEQGSFPFNRITGEWLRDSPPEGGSPLVRVVGIPYHGTVYEPERFKQIKKGSEDYLVIVAHILAAPTKGTMFEGEDIFSYRDIASWAPDASLVLLGHWHRDQGVQSVNGVSFVNVGALTRGALTQDEMTRKPACVVLGFPGGGAPVQTKVVRLRVSPAEEVFDVVGRARAEARESTMDAFVDSMKRQLEKEKGRSVEEIIEGMKDVPMRVKERVLLYLERAAQGKKA